jgi:hypothetical protein
MDIFVREDYDETVKPRPALSDELRKLEKPTRLDGLKEGDRFEIVGMKAYYRNLYLVSLSDCSATVKGEHRYHKDDPFKPFNRGYTISLSTIVKRE